MFQTQIDFRNVRATPLTVWFEPWAESIILESDQQIRIVCELRVAAAVDVELHEDTITFFGNLGSTMRAMQGERILWKSYGFPEPPLQG